MTANTSKAPVESGDDVPAVTTSPKATSKGTRKPTDLLIGRRFLLVLGALLMGYAYLGRGVAHLGVPPVYLGEFVLGLGLAATVVAAVKLWQASENPPSLFVASGSNILSPITLPALISPSR